MTPLPHSDGATLTPPGQLVPDGCKIVVRATRSAPRVRTQSGRNPEVRVRRTRKPWSSLRSVSDGQAPHARMAWGVPNGLSDTTVFSSPGVARRTDQVKEHGLGMRDRIQQTSRTVSDNPLVPRLPKEPSPVILDPCGSILGWHQPCCCLSVAPKRPAAGYDQGDAYETTGSNDGHAFGRWPTHTDIVWMWSGCRWRGGLNGCFRYIRTAS